MNLNHQNQQTLSQLYKFVISLTNDIKEHPYATLEQLIPRHVGFSSKFPDFFRATVLLSKPSKIVNQLPGLSNKDLLIHVLHLMLDVSKKSLKETELIKRNHQLYYGNKDIYDLVIDNRMELTMLLSTLFYRHEIMVGRLNMYDASA